jgi:GNAT superfamily N-acetyltransferase
VATIAGFGVDQRFQGRGLGKRLLAAALRACYDASQTFAFVAVILDCVDQAAKRFYQRFDLRELLGYPLRLFVSAKTLESNMTG